MSLFRAVTSLPMPTSPRADRTGQRSASGSSSDAMRQSVVWASLMLRASIVSLMPVDVFRKVAGGAPVDIAPPPVLVEPSSFAEGHPEPISDWLFASQLSLDGFGNAFGEITSRSTLGLPSRIELVPPEDVRVTIRGRRIVEYRFGSVVIEPRAVWHERQNLMPGIPVGMSPIVHSALSVATSKAAREFSAEWFGGSAIPGAHLKNTAQTLTPGQSDAIEARFAQKVSTGGVFVTGNDWTFSPLQAKAAESGLLESIRATDLDLCRFFGAPASMVGVSAEGGSSITYQNITQKNLDFLTTYMGPVLKRREDALSTLTPRPQFVKLNRSAFLAMDDKTRAELLKLRIESRTLTPDQARTFEDQPALEAADYAQFDRLFGNPNKSTPQKGEA